MQAMVRKTTSSDTPIGARATLQAGIEHLYADIPNGTGWANCAFNNLTLSSHFQPIFSVVQQRCVAYEGLLRANNALGTAMGPETVFALSADKQEELFLDWLCRALHLRNFGNLAVDDALIFINAFPAAAIEDPRHPGVFAKMIGHFGANPNNVVIEILETGVSDEAQLVDAAALYRQLGCKIAIDDFGVGYSNFDRLWRLRPDFVKIDRSVIVSATREAHARLVLANMVKLIQHCGAQVVVEGIETRDQALTALAAGADFLQGYYLARPGTSAMPVALCDSLFRELTGELTNKFSGDFNAPHAPNFARGMTRNQFDLTTYASMLNDAVRKLQRGVTLADATLGFLAMPQVMRTYLVTVHPVDGERPGIELHGGSQLARLEFDLIDKANQSADASDPNGWALEQLQQVMQQAIAAPQQMHYSANDDVVATVSPRSPSAITLSCAFELGERTVVLCGDLPDRRDWKSIRAGGGVGAVSVGANTFTDKFGDGGSIGHAFGESMQHGPIGMSFKDMKWSGKATSTQMGVKDFDGVRAEGKRTSYTIPAGEIGNKNPVVVTTETWTSPDLQVVVYSKHSDPRVGNSVYRLANLKRSEPASSLLMVPEGYSVKETPNISLGSKAK